MNLTEIFVVLCDVPYLHYFSVHTELVGCSGDLLPAHRAQARHASVPVALQLDKVAIAELGPILQLKIQTSM